MSLTLSFISCRQASNLSLCDIFFGCILVALATNGTQIESSNQINILGIIFDSNLKWEPQYENAIKAANHNVHAIKIIAKCFKTEEKKTLLTSLFYSKLYYGSEVWHLPGRSMTQNKKLKFA